MNSTTAFLVITILAVMISPPSSAQEATIERVDLFELTYAYDACEIEHTKIARHGPHWVWWENDAIFCLIDKRDSWLQTPPNEDFSATFRLDAPVKVHKVSLTTKKLFKSDEYYPVQWVLERLDSKGSSAEIVAENTAKEPGVCEVKLKEPVLLQNFRLRASAVEEKGTAAGEGKKAINLSDISLYAEQEVAFIAAAPSSYLTFDKKFYPYVALPNSEFNMRLWKIYSTGQSFEDKAGVKWTSSNNKVAAVDDNGRVRVKSPGKAIITASLSKSISCSVPVLVQPASAGKVDLDILYIDRWIRDKQGNLIKRNWGEEIDSVQPGERLLFRAHIINAGLKPAEGVQARWWVDGKPAGSKKLGKLSFAGGLVPTGETINPRVLIPGDGGEGEQEEEDVLPLLRHENEARFDFLESPFDGKRHTITLEIAPIGDKDSNPDNNRLTVWSDAIIFAYYMSEYTYFAYTLIQPYGWKDLPEDFKIPHAKSVWGEEEWNTRTSTACDRIQRITRVFNKQFEISRHKLTPNGITERLNCIMYIVPDPEDGKTSGVNCNRFGKANRTNDLIWGLIRSKDRSLATYTYDRMIEEFRKGSYPYIDTPLIHEVSHARYLIDLYGSQLQNREIHILDDEGNRVFPDDKEPVYDRKLRFERVKSDHGNMVGGMGYTNGWCEHAAYSLERIRGKRARAGTWNASPELGEFLNTIPDSNVVKVLTPDGKPLSGATVQVFQSVHGPWGKNGGIYSKKIDNEADITVTLDERGEAELGTCPFISPMNYSENPPGDFKKQISRWKPKGINGYNGNLNAILKITYKRKAFYKVLTVFESNLGYWYKYGLQIESFPEIKVRPDSKLTYQYTLDPNWTPEQEKENRPEIPKVY